MEKVKFYSDLLKLDLQRFAEDGRADQGGDDATETQADDTDVEEQKPFKTFKTESEMDSFFDKKLSKALKTAHSNWQKEQDEKAKHDQERENMTEEERLEDDYKKRTQELDKREAEIVKRENKSKLATQLVSDGLPAGLVDVFDGVLADEDAMNESYKTVSDVFRNAVHDAVETRLAQGSIVPKSTEEPSRKSVGETFAEKANKANHTNKDFWS